MKVQTFKVLELKVTSVRDGHVRMMELNRVPADPLDLNWVVGALRAKYLDFLETPASQARWIYCNDGWIAGQLVNADGELVPGTRIIEIETYHEIFE